MTTKNRLTASTALRLTAPPGSTRRLPTNLVAVYGQKPEYSLTNREPGKGRLKNFGAGMKRLIVLMFFFVAVACAPQSPPPVATAPPPQVEAAPPPLPPAPPPPPPLASFNGHYAGMMTVGVSGIEMQGTTDPICSDRPVNMTVSKGYATIWYQRLETPYAALSRQGRSHRDDQFIPPERRRQPLGLLSENQRCRLAWRDASRRLLVQRGDDPIIDRGGCAAFAFRFFDLGQIRTRVLTAIRRATFATTVQVSKLAGLDLGARS